MKMEPQIRKSDHTPPKMAKFGGQKSENEGPQKKAFPESIWTRTFCKKTDPNWSFLASAAPFTIYTPPIGGYHRVLDFTTQITEKYSTAMCYLGMAPWLVSHTLELAGHQFGVRHELAGH